MGGCLLWALEGLGLALLVVLLDTLEKVELALHRVVVLLRQIVA